MKVKLVYSMNKKSKCKHEWELIIREGETLFDFGKEGISLFACAKCKKCSKECSVIWQ